MLSVRAQPKSSRNDIAGVSNEQLKIRITAPPVDGKANEHLIRLLAKWMGVAKSQVTLLRGETGRIKLFAIQSPRTFPKGSEEFKAVEAARPSPP
jgi:uncharacterized protein (TIGR00251 family)